MYRIIMVLAAVALLGACGSSSLSQVGDNSDTDTDVVGSTKYVTGSIVPTSAPANLTQSAPQHLASTTQRADAPPTLAKGSPEAKAIQAETTALVAVSTPGSAYYKIGPRDVLDVSVFKVAELSKQVQVSETGTVNLPLVGEIATAGKTPREVEKEITALFGSRYLKNPQVSVYVKEFNSQRVTIEGAVKQPGVLPMQGNLSLLQAVAMAHGMSDISDNTVLVFRSTGGKRSAARFDISDIRSGETQDPQLQAGDVVVAGSSALKEGFQNFMKVVPLASFLTIL